MAEKKLQQLVVESDGTIKLYDKLVQARSLGTPKLIEFFYSNEFGTIFNKAFYTTFDRFVLEASRRVLEADSYCLGEGYTSERGHDRIFFQGAVQFYKLVDEEKK